MVLYEMGACGKPRNWSSWWVMDGSDDADSLRAADRCGKLNEQVAEAIKNFQTRPEVSVSILPAPYHEFRLKSFLPADENQELQGILPFPL